MTSQSPLKVKVISQELESSLNTIRIFLFFFPTWDPLTEKVLNSLIFMQNCVYVCLETCNSHCLLIMDQMNGKYSKS